MKYLRVITVVVITFIFLAALAVGIGVIFAVRNINITIESYTYGEDSETANEEIARYKENFMDLYKGKLINTVSEEDISKNLTDWNCDYTLTSFEKILPCTINITLLERRETYVYDNGDGTYNVYDLDGALIRVADSEADTMNTTGDTPSPNVMLSIPDESYVEEAAALGKAFQASFSESFEKGAPIRSTVESIYIVERTSSYAGNNVIFQLRSGIQVVIYDYEDYLLEKMTAAYSKFVQLDAESKLTGYIYCYYLNDGTLSSAYQPSGKVTDND
ncbi:MAG: hypothetical protein LUE27_01610 [Clostridia bacterium]|nr:hypothetical protein [Clostridia bacterium]